MKLIITLITILIGLVSCSSEQESTITVKHAFSIKHRSISDPIYYYLIEGDSAYLLYKE